MSKPKLVIFGSSHAKRLTRAVEKNAKYSNFDIKSFTYPGARYEKLRQMWPTQLMNGLNERDKVILQCLGNDMFLPNTHYITYKPKVIHLKRFAPTELKEFSRLAQALFELVSKVKAQIIIISNPYRACACRQHQYKGLIGHQHRSNNLIKQVFGSRYVDWSKLVTPNKQSRANRCWSKYMELSLDGVHFKDLVYEKIALTLFDRLG